MANHFPDAPGPALVLASVAYNVTLPGALQLLPSSPFAYAEARTTLQTWFHAGSWGMVFSFTTPGEPGSFDQDTVEAAMNIWLTHVALALRVVAGLPLADVLLAISVQRVWQWTDLGTGTASWSDQMPGPAIYDSDASAVSDAERLVST